MTKPKSYNTDTHPKTLLIGVHAPYNKTQNIQSYYDEFLHLVSSNDIKYDDALFIKLRTVDAGYFFTKGKVEEIQKLCEQEQYEEIIISDQLTAQQERNLNTLLKAHIFDRTHLILEIFERSAHSAEGKMQVEIALFHHKKSRLVGQGITMSQQAGHIGGRGPGETEKEKKTRYIEQNISKLKRRLKELEKNRDTQRKRRLDNKIPHICLIGYTNTGKSTVLNQLTKADVLAQDKLFATLDTTTRELYLNHKKIGVISDTVGFIQQLPHQLINAFKSTLSELQHADLLLHIIDIADPNWEEHIVIVNSILKELDVDKDVVYVFNKADMPIEMHADEKLRDHYQPNITISARSKDGIINLVKYLENWKKK
jgi:GTP-binding protein HflX